MKIGLNKDNGGIMSDKIQLIKQEIGRLLDEYPMSRGLLKHLNKFIDSLPEEPKCIYNKTLDERKKFCKYCSAACIARIEEEPVSEDFEEEIVSWLKNGNITDTRYDNYADSDIEATARHFAEWQKQQDYKMYAHISLKDIHDAWQELKKNKPDIENYPAVCFQKGADWRENHMKELFRTEYEKGRFDMREELLKDTADATIKFKYLNCSQNNTIT